MLPILTSNDVTNNRLIYAVFQGQLSLAYGMGHSRDALLWPARGWAVALANLGDLLLGEFGRALARAARTLSGRWLWGLDPAATTDHVSGVLDDCAQVQVVRANAAWRVAVMKHPRLRPGAAMQHPGNTRSQRGVSAAVPDLDAAVAPAHQRTGPQPARFRLLDLGPEAFRKRSFHMPIVLNSVRP
jgi:hypothetical protein